MTKQFHKYARVHSQMHNSSSYQKYMHLYEKVKVDSDSKQNVGNIDFFFQHNNLDDFHSNVLGDNIFSSIFESILLNQQTSKTPSK